MGGFMKIQEDKLIETRQKMEGTLLGKVMNFIMFDNNGGSILPLTFEVEAQRGKYCSLDEKEIHRIVEVMSEGVLKYKEMGKLSAIPCFDGMSNFITSDKEKLFDALNEIRKERVKYISHSPKTLRSVLVKGVTDLENQIVKLGGSIKRSKAEKSEQLLDELRGLGERNGVTKQKK